MKMFNRINKTTIDGNVVVVNLNQGNNGPYGTVRLAHDASFTKKGSQERVEKTTFVNLKVDSFALKNLTMALEVGDYLIVSGELITEEFQDNQTQKNREATKVRVSHIDLHLPKSVKEMLKQQGLIGMQTRPYQAQNQAPAQPTQQWGGQQDATAPKPAQVNQQNQAWGQPQQPQGNGGFYNQ
ncbi:single-stranded DNA-binding protein [Motilimonas eburnea]|uniref:single-stranded DNA-binding protein n=1 Tax=Motilimonas eburnea TaxID=1737488 RepID=UPI001E2F9E3B|nr:single-stranded DNA-binding protein [Motilimonas eburnea]MCE2571705.1 single-stranded DNA-binding protein [Motilimonas eburnea]